ncbi:MAG: NADH-quinone oxidoreductase subunit NuoF [Candidatus Bipolaricaulis sp.]|nr:NADH-quinone oxidoreductase subunit NuoF [Candidatus Bipolaricaulis sp.]
MRLARTHVLVSVNDEALLAGVRDVQRALRAALAERGLSEEVQVIETGDPGIAGHGVILVVHPDGVAYGRVAVSDVKEIVEEHLVKGRPVRRLRIARRSATMTALGERSRIVLRNCGVIDPENLDEAIAAGAYEGIAHVIETGMSPANVVALVKQSGLRGRGGAGFPTGMKWGFTAPGEVKYIVCNADEGEPGTFKDRLILEGDPHRLLEGIMLAGYAVGATKGYVYIRGEYALSIRRMQKAIDDARAAGLLGDSILGASFSFDVEVKKGAGAYVCGEETALIESIEGKRGYPRLKPPYPGAVGLWARPTVVNNVETLANVPPIVVRGAEWFRSFGTASCPGTKVYTILGHVEAPGLVEVEMGTPLRRIIWECGGGVRGGKRFKAALIGGAAGGFVDESQLDVAMDFDGLKEYAGVLGSGAILVVDEDTSIVELLHGILRFFRHESCGQCAPCRTGTAALVQLSEAIRTGNASPGDVDRLVDIARTMQATSLCPLGQSLILPVKSAVDRFRSEFQAASA